MKRVIIITWKIDGENHQKMYDYPEGKQKIRDAHTKDEATRMCRGVAQHGRAKSDTAICFRKELSDQKYEVCMEG